MRILLCLFALALPARGQAPARRPPPAAFETQLVHASPGALSPVDDLLAALRDSSDRQKQISAMDQLALSAARLTMEEQLRVVAALREAYDNPVNEGGVRGRALDTIGKSAVWFKDLGAVRDAVTALTEAAHVDNPSDARSSLRVYALLGLSRAAGHLLWTDERTEELVVLTGLDGIRDARTAQEKLLSMMVFSNYVESRGAGVVWRNPNLAERAEEQILRPCEGALDSLYSDAKSNSDFRYFLMRGLNALAWTIGTRGDLRFRVGQIFRRMSDREPDARLRELARIYAARIGR
ncbi:MAG: hypothetical protein HY077_12185 [Elusimicrobia bacterium]|nr:hypothetical protein [Elusimicrobiota bacterium]